MPLALDSLVSSLFLTVEIGSLYALMSVGLTLTMAVTKIPNIAHAEYVAIGAYVCFYLTKILGLGLAPTLVGAFLVSAIVAWLSYRIIFRPLSSRGSPSFILMIASFALDLILRYTIYIIAAPNQWLGVEPGINVSIIATFGFIDITNIFVLAVPAAITLMILLHVFMRRTKLGKSMRAIADNRQLSHAIGIDSERVNNVTWIIAGGLAGIAGAFFAILTSAQPEIGFQSLIDMFAASSIGGFISLPATMIGGYVVALGENTGIVMLNQLFELSFTFKALIPILIMVVILVIRPQGLSEISLNRIHKELVTIARKFSE